MEVAIATPELGGLEGVRVVCSQQQQQHGGRERVHASQV